MYQLSVFGVRRAMINTFDDLHEFGFGYSLVFTRTEARAMKDKTKEQWMELCEQAACEEDPDRLIELVQKIDRMLEEKETRLKRAELPRDLNR